MANNDTKYKDNVGSIYPDPEEPKGATSNYTENRTLAHKAAEPQMPNINQNVGTVTPVEQAESDNQLSSDQEFLKEQSKYSRTTIKY